MKRTIIVGSLILSAALFACNSQTESSSETKSESTEHQSAEINTSADITEGQEVYFPNLEDGQEITLPFAIEFGVKGMEVEASGPINKDKGHHHLLVDSDPIPAGKTVPANETNVHYGGGQLADSLMLSKFPTLTPGEHTLTLQFADGIHTSYGAAMSKTIKVIVK